jgi:DNA helicase IV
MARDLLEWGFSAHAGKDSTLLSQLNNSTVRELASNSAAELAAEQAYLTLLYERLDALRAVTGQRLAAVRLGPTAENDQGWSERESFMREYLERTAELDAAERNLCFGRLDFDEGDQLYVGRLGLRGEDHEQLLVDWRARAAEPFYRATARERYGVTRRRHLHTAGRRVVRLDDDVLDLDAVDDTRLTGEAALLASLRRGRTGRMGDIVATIQADQDRVIRADPGGILVVEGGPGTGKTVVALHRAAYLLYTHRKRLARRGILVLGPSATFLRYIDQVLPSLGENDVVLATAGSLFPGVDPGGTDTPEAARVKGNATMAGVLAKAVTALRRVPADVIEVKVDGAVYRLTPRVCQQARDRAEELRDDDTGDPLPHNIARRVFIGVVTRELASQRVRGLGGQRALPRDEEQEELRADLAAAPAVRGVLDMLWPEFTPQQLLTRLYQQPGLLDLADDERAAIGRDTPGPWTPADVPLLDELAELLGPVEVTQQAAERQRAEDAAERAEALEYAAQLVAKMTEDEAIVVPFLEKDAFTAWIADRNAASAAGGELTERALQDRAWAYGHVIVDEAQELSAMDWRMVLRRCPARSMTVVGDLAQTAAPGGAESWAQVLDPVAAGRWRTARLTVNYRTPAPVMALAATLLPAGAEPPLSVRDSDEIPWRARLADLADVVLRETVLIGTGRVAVIAPPARVQATAAALGLTPGADLDAPVAVLTPAQSKGLEFDSVIVVDPDGIEHASPRGRADLYVALTRTTRRLGLVSPGEATAAIE